MAKQFGFVVNDVDVNDVNADQLSTIRQRVLAHGLVILPGQKLVPRDLETFTARLGQTIRLSDLMSPEEHEEGSDTVVRVSNIRRNGDIIPNRYPTTSDWHTDGDFWPRPDNCVWNLLYGERVPSRGGATAFADCYEADRTLTPEQRRALSGKKIVVDFSILPNMGNEVTKNIPVVTHDMVATHPLTGRQHLYVSGPASSIQIEGLGKEESRDEMSRWHEHVTRPDNVHIHAWNRGDLIIWDNLSTLHRAYGDYGDEPRLLYKTQVRVSSPSTSAAGARR